MTENTNTNDRIDGDVAPTAPLEPTPSATEVPSDAAPEPTVAPAAEAASGAGDPEAEKAARIARTNRIALGIGGGVLAAALLVGTFGAGLSVGSHVGGGQGRASHARGMDPRGEMQGRGFDGPGGDFGRGGKGGRGGQDGQRGPGQQGPGQGRPDQGQGQGPGGQLPGGPGMQNGLPQGHPDTSAPSGGSTQPDGDGVLFMQ